MEHLIKKFTSNCPTVSSKETRSAASERRCTGLKQALKIWYEIIRDFLLKLGFVQNEADESVFIHEGKKLCVTVYVDDLLLFGKDMKNINWLKKQLATKFDMKDLGEVHHYLDMKLVRDRKKKTITLTQRAF
jgi:Reverse transcriptase (RNA-dependent DNA polymerase)